MFYLGTFFDNFDEILFFALPRFVIFYFNLFIRDVFDENSFICYFSYI